MHYFVLFVLFIFSTEGKTNNCSLSSVYDSEDIKFAIHQQVILEAKKSSPYLVNPANHFRRKIKRDYIEEGLPLETIEDLEIALKSFNYLSVKIFREE